MSESTSKAQTRIAVNDGQPIVIDAETALDRVYSALADERRRRVLSVLTQESTPIDVETLARGVTIQEAAADSGMVTEEAISQVRLSLYHHHLPKLSEVGLISYDPEEKIVGEITGSIGSDDV